MNRPAVAEVELDADHPGHGDPGYRRRRAEIAAVGAAHEPGRPIPDVDYTPAEDALWAQVSAELARRHRTYACAEVVEAGEALALPSDRVPQLREVTARLDELTGFRMEPVPGLVPTAEFYGALADRTFRSTQYLRHPSAPFYTPEPDLIHEVMGHGTTLASPRLADLYQAAGAASRRVEGEDALDLLSRVFWFSVEFGVVHEEGEVRAYGAGLLSSYGEIEAFRRAEIRPLDVAAMGTTDYDISVFQPVLFAGPSLAATVDELTGFFEAYDDDAHERMMREERPCRG